MLTRSGASGSWSSLPCQHLRPRLRRASVLRAALAAAGALASAHLAGAQGSTAPPPPAEKPAPLQRVEVNGESRTADRRYATSAKLIVSAEELTRFGDTSIAEALQRVPGISVARTDGKELEIRLRGLGNGYTQILLDGSPVPRNFSIESLSPEMVERIEVIKSPTADLGTQAIAGTINIISKRALRKPVLAAKVAAGMTNSKGSGQASLDYSDRQAQLAWGLSSSLVRTTDTYPLIARSSETLADGREVYARTNVADERVSTNSLSLAPTFEYKLGDQRTLSLGGWVQGGITHYLNLDRRQDIRGEPPRFVSDSLGARTTYQQGRLTAQYKGTAAEHARLETKLILASSRRHSDALLLGQDAAEKPVLERVVASLAKEHSVNATGKLAMDLGDDHALAAGWDLQTTHRSEVRLQTESSPIAGYPTEDLDERYTARIHRAAAFLQDEWTVSPRLSAYIGIRWESLRTSTTGTELPGVAVRSSVASPVAQVLWKVPDTKSDQVRLNLGRTYKAPTARELVPRRWVVNDNAPTTPNFQGNPTLQPELAWTLDLAYERYLANGALVNLGVFMRRIQDVVLPVTQEIDGRWVERPSNAGAASVQGLEGEFKGSLRTLFAAAPDVQLRMGLMRAWSSVGQLPAPGNRLSRQPRALVTLGADGKVGRSAWTAGINFAFEQGAYARNSRTSAVTAPDVRKLDLYALWEPTRTHKLRLSLTNALAPSSRRIARYEDGEILAIDDGLTKSYFGLKAQFESSF